MPVSIGKKQSQEQLEKPKDHLKPAKAKEPLSVLSPDEMAAVDRMLEIHEELAPVLHLLKEQEKLKKQLAAVALDATKFEPDQPAVLKGKKGIVEFDAEVRRREIVNKNGLIGVLKAKIGYEGLIEQIGIPLKVIDTYLSEAERAPFLKPEDEGSRKLASVRPRKE